MAQAAKEPKGMSFTLSTGHWFAFQMLPAYGGNYAPFFAPIHVRGIQPLKTGRGELKIDYFNPLYVEGVQLFENVRLKVLLRADHYLMARLQESSGSGSTRAAVIGDIGFSWLYACCPGLVAAVPPGSPLAPETEHASAYLDQVFLRHEADQPTERQLDDEAENDWLTACALRFDGHLYAQKHRMPGEFAPMLEWIGHAPEFNHDLPGLMAAMFLLQRGLMKEGIRSKTSQAWKVFRLLFLRLCSHPVPDEYRLEDFCTRWEREYVPKLRIGQEIIQAMHVAGPYGTRLY